MTTDPTHEPFTQDEVAALAAKLEAWAAQLPPREQQLVAQLVARATAPGEDVQGFFFDSRFNTFFSSLTPPPPASGGGGSPTPAETEPRRLN